MKASRRRVERRTPLGRVAADPGLGGSGLWVIVVTWDFILCGWFDGGWLMVEFWDAGERVPTMVMVDILWLGVWQ